MRKQLREQIDTIASAQQAVATNDKALTVRMITMLQRQSVALNKLTELLNKPKSYRIERDKEGNIVGINAGSPADEEVDKELDAFEQMMKPSEDDESSL